MLPGTGGDLQSLQVSLCVYAGPEHRQDGLLVPLRSGGVKHCLDERYYRGAMRHSGQNPLQHNRETSVQNHTTPPTNVFGLFFFLDSKEPLPDCTT